MSLEEALRDQEERVDQLLKSAQRLTTTLKAWKKACQLGHMANRQKAATSSEDITRELQGPVAAAASSWTFDVRAYLESDAWRQELTAAARDHFGLRVFEEEDTLVSPPVVVRAQSGVSRLRVGKAPWPTLHPVTTAEYLKRLRDKSASLAASQQFLDDIYAACKRYQPGDLSMRLADIYRHWSGAPGWKRDNTPAAFSQQIDALVQSGIRLTSRDSRAFQIGGPVGKYSSSDVFDVIDQNGKLQRYYSISFR